MGNQKNRLKETGFLSQRQMFIMVSEAKNNNFTLKYFVFLNLCNSYTMSYPPVCGDNPRALESGLSYVQVDKHGITVLYRLTSVYTLNITK